MLECSALFFLCRTIIETVDLRGGITLWEALFQLCGSIFTLDRCEVPRGVVNRAFIRRRGSRRPIFSATVQYHDYGNCIYRGEDSRKSSLCPTAVPSRINSQVPSTDGARQLTVTYGRSSRRRKKKSRILHTSASTFTGRVAVDRTTGGDTYLTNRCVTLRRERRTSVFPRSLEPATTLENPRTSRNALALPSWDLQARLSRVLVYQFCGFSSRLPLQFFVMTIGTKGSGLLSPFA